MKKSLLLLLAAFLLSLTAGAINLAPNQLLMGHYTTDDLATVGWGQNFLKNTVCPIATDLTAEELSRFQGGKVVTFRIGLFEAAPISRLFVMPIDADGDLTGDVIEWPCDLEGQAGWNEIQLETPYEINLPDNYGLRIGFDYKQVDAAAKPISAVMLGTIYDTFIYRYGRWQNYGVNTYGNLSLQLVVENDNYPTYLIRVKDLLTRAKVKIGNDLAFSFMTCNYGINSVQAGECTYQIFVDDNLVGTMTNPQALTDTYQQFTGTISTDGLSEGSHTLKVTAVSINGEALENPASVSCTFITFELGYSRQMRLVEQFTSTYCTYCPQGTANLVNLTNMRDDIAWVAVHENMSGGTDPFRTAQCDSISSYQGINGFPEGTFDRTVGIAGASSLYGVLTGMPASTMSSFLDYVESLEPSWATVNINSTYDPDTRKAVITVDGALEVGFDDVMGADSKLTVYITEDGLVASQYNSGTWVHDYVHNNVLRVALGSVKGVNLNRTDNAYKNEFTYTIPQGWKAENLSIVAFVSRPLRANALTDVYVTNANKRKLGENDGPAVVIGDLTGDGILNIADVTALIYIVLNSEPADLDVADLTGDGILNIADVTALITMVLNQ